MEGIDEKGSFGAKKQKQLQLGPRRALPNWALPDTGCAGAESTVYKRMSWCTRPSPLQAVPTRNTVHAAAHTRISNNTGREPAAVQVIIAQLIFS